MVSTFVILFIVTCVALLYYINSVHQTLFVMHLLFPHNRFKSC